MKQQSRFQIVSGECEEEVNLPSADAVLSKAITRASQSEDPGEWIVREYEDDLYRVRRTGYIVRQHGEAKPSIYVEVLS